MPDKYDSRHYRLDPHHDASKYLCILQPVWLSRLGSARLDPIFKLVGIPNLADMAP